MKTLPPFFGLRLPAILRCEAPGSKILVLSPDWMPHPGETDEQWTERLGPGVVAIINVLLEEKP